MKKLASKLFLVLALTVGAFLSLNGIFPVQAQNDWPHGSCRGCICSPLTAGGSTFYGCGAGPGDPSSCCYPEDTGCFFMECPSPD